ncbi:MAG: nuclease [Pedosphaera sp.]|nr:nuclease [Pedosphaera sp.]
MLLSAQFLDRAHSNHDAFSFANRGLGTGIAFRSHGTTCPGWAVISPQHVMTHIFHMLLSFVPVGVLAAAHGLWRRIHLANGQRMPVTEKPLRSAGETARRKTEALDARVTNTLIWVIGFPAVIVAAYLSSKQTGAPTIPRLWTVLIVSLTGVYVLLIERLILLVNERNQWRLGCSGEQAVGEELNKLALAGWQVFHDFPLGDDGHIDHVVVAASGIFTIETKAKRKGPYTASHKAHEVVYDGTGLQFPDCLDTDSLEHARAQAQALGKFLGDALPSPVAVKPILTFPGWYVIPKGTGDVMVVNPRMIDSALVGDGTEVLSSEQIRVIARQLEKKCRDFEA